MRLVATRRAVGAQLANDVRDGRPGAIPLLRAGTVVTKEYGERLIAAGINAVYVDDELSRGIEVTSALKETTRSTAERALAKAFKEAPAAVDSGKPLSNRTIAELQEVSRMISVEIAGAGDAVLALSDLAAADSYTLQHSIDVAVVGLIVARQLFLYHGSIDGRQIRSLSGTDGALVRLGVGLLLHDVGKLAVPQEILQKSGPLSAEEWELIRQHPACGVDMIRTDLISYHSKAVIRSHHERWDGGGYPDRLLRDRVPEFARIAAVADVYDAVTSERPYKRAASPAVGHATILAGAGSAFDPDVVDAFARAIAPYPPGCEVVLADGRQAIVAEVPQGHLDRPVLRVVSDDEGKPVQPFELPLLDHPELSLQPVAAA